MVQSAYVFAAVGSTGLAADLLKIVFGRARPKLLFLDGYYGFQPLAFHADYWSLPSGHATTAGAVGMALFMLWPRYWPFYLGFAAFVAISRVIITVHYLSDALFGLYLGALGSCVMVWLWERRGYPLHGANEGSFS